MRFRPTFAEAMGNERRTVEDCVERMSAAERRGKRALASFWLTEAQRTRLLELAAVPERGERRRQRGTVVDLFRDPESAP